MVKKRTRTRREIAKAIENYKKKNYGEEAGSPYFAVMGPHFKEDSRRVWLIRTLNNYYVGLLRQNGRVIIKYDGVPEHALACDHLRQACEEGNINYQEKMANEEGRSQSRIVMLRNAGRTLINITTRLGAQIQK